MRFLHSSSSAHRPHSICSSDLGYEPYSLEYRVSARPLPLDPSQRSLHPTSKMTQIVADHPMFPPDPSNAWEKAVVECERSPGVVDAERPDLANLKETTANCGILNPSAEEKTDDMNKTHFSPSFCGVALGFNVRDMVPI